MRFNKLSINPDKTEFMVIGNPHRTNKLADLPPFFLGKNEISRVNKSNYLGVTVDDKLNWGDQIRSESCQRLGIFQKAKKHNLSVTAYGSTSAATTQGL